MYLFLPPQISAYEAELKAIGIARFKLNRRYRLTRFRENVTKLERRPRWVSADDARKPPELPSRRHGRMESRSLI